MSGSKIDLQVFFDGVDHAALLVPGDDLFGLMRRRVDLPAAWSALVTKASGGQVLVRPGQVVEGDGGVEDVFFVRVTPMALAFDECVVTSQDGFRCVATVGIRVGVIPERGDLATFRKTVLGSRRTINTVDLLRYLSPSLRLGLVDAAGDCEAASLVDGRAAEQVAGTVAKALQGTCFEAGLVIEGGVDVRFESDAVRRVQVSREEAVRKTVEHEASRELRTALAAAQREHVDHLTGLLERLTALAADSPGAAFSGLIKTFSEKQRGELYTALFSSQIAANATEWIVVAAGAELLFYKPGDFAAPKRRLTVSGAVGGVRSVQCVLGETGSPVLLLGAATGIYSLRLDQSELDPTYTVDHARSVRGGFNSAALLGDSIYGAHSELGLYQWRADDPGHGQVLFEALTGGAKTVRGVCAYGGSLYCAVDDRVIVWRPDAVDHPSHVYTGSADAITALCVTGDGVFAGNSDGDVLLWTHGQHDDPERLHRGSRRAAESICVLDGGGVKRLIYTDTSLSVRARVLGDSFLCEYEAGGQTLRRAEVAADLIVATSDIRDRIICWAPNKPGQPHGTIPVSSLTGRSVQDVCLVPRV